MEEKVFRLPDVFRILKDQTTSRRGSTPTGQEEHRAASRRSRSRADRLGRDPHLRRARARERARSPASLRGGDLRRRTSSEELPARRRSSKRALVLTGAACARRARALLRRATRGGHAEGARKGFPGDSLKVASGLARLRIDPWLSASPSASEESRPMSSRTPSTTSCNEIKSLEPLPQVAMRVVCSWRSQEDVIPRELVEVIQTDAGHHRQGPEALQLGSVRLPAARSPRCPRQATCSGVSTLVNLVLTSCASRYFRDYGREHDLATAWPAAAAGKSPSRTPSRLEPDRGPHERRRPASRAYTCRAADERRAPRARPLRA